MTVRIDTTKDGMLTEAPVQALADFAYRLTVDDLPEDVVGRSHEILLDMLGVIVWGAQDEFLAALAAQLIPRTDGQASVLGTRLRTDPGRAALLNAGACTVTQIDEGHRRSRGHPAIHVLPTALAIAEREGCSGGQLIAALVAGYETAVRIGRSMAPLRPELHAHGHWPVLGAAVAGAKLLGGDRTALATALESASTLTLFPTTKTAAEGVTVHHLYAGLGCHTAVTVAYGAVAGMTAGAGTLVDYFGPLSSDAFSPESLMGDGLEIATEFEVLNNYFKPQPVCAHLLTTIECMQAIRGEIHDPSTVRSVTVRTYGLASSLDEQEPRTSLAAKFSIPYAVAATVLNPEMTARVLHEPDLEDPRLLDLMSRVEVVLDPELDAQYPDARPAVVNVDLADGRRLEMRKDMPRGDAANPLSPAELSAKFLDLAGPVLGSGRAQRVSELALQAADLDDVRTLTELCCPT